MNCPICLASFDSSQFSGSGGTNRIYCYNCLPYGLPKKERVSINRKLTLERVSMLKLKTGCQNCGYNKSSSALEFHHVYPETKVEDPSYSAKISWNRFVTESKKCILLCANCHREQQEGLITQERVLEIFSQV